MPVGEQAAGRSLGTIFYPARPTARFARGQLWHLFLRFLSGRGLSSQHGAILIWTRAAGYWRTCFDANLVAPREISPLDLEAGEITAAGRAAEGTGAEAQQDPCPSGRIIVVRGPFGKFLAVTPGTARVPPGSVGPDAGLPAVVAAAATKIRNAQ